MAHPSWGRPSTPRVLLGCLFVSTLYRPRRLSTLRLPLPFGLLGVEGSHRPSQTPCSSSPISQWGTPRLDLNSTLTSLTSSLQTRTSSPQPGSNFYLGRKGPSAPLISFPSRPTSSPTPFAPNWPFFGFGESGRGGVLGCLVKRRFVEVKFYPKNTIWDTHIPRSPIRDQAISQTVCILFTLQRNP